ncbi:MAG: hypothetical protein CSB55_04500 [Candidatus Cloacimonadota bacterium]|nr:MAG: hypothetical protein CSB55_04500 [Candidatus Cloacimonadota bacterium]
MKCDNAYIREKVLKTAKNIMLGSGLKGVNMDILAKESGIAKATLYKIIESKQALIEKITLDFFAASFGHLFESILNKKSYQNFNESDIDEITSLAVGKMRVIQKQVFLEYPRIEEKFKILIEDYRDKVENQFRILQANGEITESISPENIFKFVKMIFMQMVMSSYSDLEVKSQLSEMYYIFFKGLKA